MISIFTLVFHYSLKSSWKVNHTIYFMNKSICESDLSPIKIKHFGKIFPDIFVFLCFIVIAGKRLWYFLTKIFSGKFSIWATLFTRTEIESILSCFIHFIWHIFLKQIMDSFISFRDLDNKYNWKHKLWEIEKIFIYYLTPVRLTNSAPMKVNVKELTFRIL